jgi:acetyl-CoA carboxylase biotin carboxyl carrier protein
MIDLEFVEKLIRTLDESSLDSIEIERGGTRIRLAKTPTSTGSAGAGQAQSLAPATANPSPALEAHAAPNPPQVGGQVTGQATAPAEAPSNLIDITSPMVGTFYRSPSPDADPFTRTGESISAGDVLCIIEAMKLMNELEAEVDGKIREVCVENGEPVEYGQVLFRVEPA